ncbi:MAG TPA: glycosyltransferase, partial [Stellaceae bacterium]|nr:glycosyltransferase [Stellaceae bacterium]
MTFTTLFPNAEQPNHGIFVENRLRHLVASGAAESVVVAPVPYFPARARCFGRWSRYARIGAREERHGIVVYHPRFPVIPRIGMAASPALLAAAMLGFVRRIAMRDPGFDLIDAHYFYPDGVAAAWIGRQLRRPVVITARGTDVNLIPRYRLPRIMIRWAIGEAAGLIAVSGALKQALVELGAAPERVAVLRNGVDLSLFRPGDRDTARRALGLSRPTLLSVGHLIERKGHHRVIEALCRLPGFDLLVVGDGPERGRLEQLGRRLGVAERVRLLGAVGHAALPAIYTAADALVLASSREGWANVLLEAMACGTPVI